MLHVSWISEEPVVHMQVRQKHGDGQTIGNTLTFPVEPMCSKRHKLFACTFILVACPYN